jgi:hypothetical protein
MRAGRTGPATAAALVAGLLLLLVPGQVSTTGAAFSDAATTTTGVVGAGPFVPAPANAVECGTTGTTLNPASTITFTTPRVAAPIRGTVEYVVRIYRTDVTPEQKIGEDVLMTVGATTATASWTGGGLTLLQNTNYQARITTRLTGVARESTPIRTRNFRNTGLLIANFICGTGT